jgi:hypothetical protein
MRRVSGKPAMQNVVYGVRWCNSDKQLDRGRIAPLLSVAVAQRPEQQRQCGCRDADCSSKLACPAVAGAASRSQCVIATAADTERSSVDAPGQWPITKSYIAVTLGRRRSSGSQAGKTIPRELLNLSISRQRGVRWVAAPSAPGQRRSSRSRCWRQGASGK